MIIIRLLRTLFVISAVLAGMVSCGLFAGGGDEITGLADSLIDIPSALVNAEVGTSSVADVPAYLDYLYKPVRNTYNPLALSAIRYVESLLEAVEANIFGERSIRRALDTDGSWAGKNKAKTEAYRVTKHQLNYTVEIWKTVDSQWLKTLHLDFYKAGEVYRGTATAVDDTSGLTERPTYKVIFDTNDASYGQVTELRATNINFADGADPNIARKLWLKAWQLDRDFFITANIHYTHIDIESQSPFYEEFMAELGKQSPAENVKASYIYRGSVDVDTEHAGVSLALVPQTVSSVDTVFSVYSIGEMYLRFDTSSS